MKYFLVHRHGYTNRQAKEIIGSGKLLLNGKPMFNDEVLEPGAELKLGEHVLHKPQQFVYLRFYKPRGLESSLSDKVPANISSYFTGFQDLAIAGRLDKESECLLLLSNDGKWVEGICNPKFEKEKEYLVELDEPVDAEFVEKFEKGVQLGEALTKPCICKMISPTRVNVILKEGRNRQIRRMCHKLGRNVTRLIRIRIGEVILADLENGKAGEFTPDLKSTS